jgi:L-aminoadipate-semialdehyde dehydrogenase
MVHSVLRSLGLGENNRGIGGVTGIESPGGAEIASINPATGLPIARVRMGSVDDYGRIAEASREVFERWKRVPAPRRGEVIRHLGQALREKKSELGLLVTLETGKIRSEGEGEVQEMIDMCDFAVGLSRQLHGLTIASERANHRMIEQWHPLGPVGIITAFNFPVAVWAWNAALAAVCGDSTVWKPSPEAPLTAMAVQNLAHRVAEANGFPGLFAVCVGEAEIGRAMAADRRFPLVSATGSCRMGSAVGQAVAGRLGRSLLELGGNNAVIVSPKADFDLALRAVAFSAVGTAGQRCTSLRRLILHESIADRFLARLKAVYASIKIGDPSEDDVLMGPLINERAVEAMMRALEGAKAQGGTILQGGKRLDRPGFFVEPTIVWAEPAMPIVAEETFAPILYAMTYHDLDEALAIQNGVDQGLASAIFTDSVVESERFLSSEGSDCGIANVNIGTSGAEIGGAFGGEKDTGGGREAGSDAWKAYMRRQTCTINGGKELPLAQGVKFEIDA